MATTVRPGTVVLHSKDDEVAACADSEELLHNGGLIDSGVIVVVGTEHWLADEESLEAMARAVEV